MILNNSTKIRKFKGFITRISLLLNMVIYSVRNLLRNKKSCYKFFLKSHSKCETKEAIN